MTDLKHKTLEELQVAKRKCQAKIKHHGSIWSGQKERLDWINKYIEIKAPATADSYMDYTSMDTVMAQRAIIRTNKIAHATQADSGLPAVDLGPAPEATNDINRIEEPFIGACVKYIDPNRVLRSGATEYSYAITVSLDPFILVSPSADMRWESTVKYNEFKSIGEVSKATFNKCLTRLGG